MSPSSTVTTIIVGKNRFFFFWSFFFLLFSARCWYTLLLYSTHLRNVLVYTRTKHATVYHGGEWKLIDVGVPTTGQTLTRLIALPGTYLLAEKTYLRGYHIYLYKKSRLKNKTKIRKNPEQIIYHDRNPWRNNACDVWVNAVAQSSFNDKKEKTVWRRCCTKWNKIFGFLFFFFFA